MEAMTMEAPGITFPAIAKLSNALTKYQQANTEVSAIEVRLARLEIDETDCLNDVTLDEDEQCSRLVTIRAKQDVQGKRVEHKRLEVSRVLGELEEAYPAAETEVSAAQALEYTRRQEVLIGQVRAVLALTPEQWEADNSIFQAVSVSPFLTVLRACGPNGNAGSTSAELKAQQLLELSDKLQSEIEKQI
jgi:hypothetical protein